VLTTAIAFLGSVPVRWFSFSILLTLPNGTTIPPAGQFVEQHGRASALAAGRRGGAALLDHGFCSLSGATIQPTHFYRRRRSTRVRFRHHHI
jgi:hypothetical protein